MAIIKLISLWLFFICCKGSGITVFVNSDYHIGRALNGCNNAFVSVYTYDSTIHCFKEIGMPRYYFYTSFVRAECAITILKIIWVEIAMQALNFKCISFLLKWQKIKNFLLFVNGKKIHLRQQRHTGELSK